MYFEQQIATVVLDIFGTPLFLGIFLMFFFFLLAIVLTGGKSGEIVFFAMIISMLTTIVYFIPVLIPLAVIVLGLFVGLLLWLHLGR